MMRRPLGHRRRQASSDDEFIGPVRLAQKTLRQDPSDQNNARAERVEDLKFEELGALFSSTFNDVCNVVAEAVCAAWLECGSTGWASSTDNAAHKSAVWALIIGKRSGVFGNGALESESPASSDSDSEAADATDTDATSSEDPSSSSSDADGTSACFNEAIRGKGPKAKAVIDICVSCGQRQQIAASQTSEVTNQLSRVSAKLERAHAGS